MIPDGKGPEENNSPEARREAKLVPRGKGNERPDRPGRLAAMLANWLGVKLTGHDKGPDVLPLCDGLVVVALVVLADEEEEEDEEEGAVAVVVVVMWRDPFNANWYDDTAGCCPVDGSVIAEPRPLPPPPPTLPPFCLKAVH